MLCFDFRKRPMKGEKHIAPMDFAEVYYGGFLQKGIHEDIVIIVNVHQMHSILKVC